MSRPPKSSFPCHRPFGLWGSSQGLVPHQQLADGHILLVTADEEDHKAVRSAVGTLGREIIETSSTDEAIVWLKRGDITLCLVDFRVPALGGPGLCATIKSNRLTRFVPVFLLANQYDLEGEILGVNSGADAFLVKPLNAHLLRVRVLAALKQKAMLDGLDDAEAALFSLAQLVEARDCSTGTHCLRLANLACGFGAFLGLSEADLMTLQRGAYLHDIGKVSVPDAILFKRGPLSPDEWEIMRRHPLIGSQICEPLRSLVSVLPVIRSHHERWDGSGYPDGLRGRAIPFLARILQVADIFDALTSERPYKPAYSTEAAVRILIEEAHAGWRDTEMIEQFVEFLPSFQAAGETELWRSSLNALSVQLRREPARRQPTSAKLTVFPTPNAVLS